MVLDLDGKVQADSFSGFNGMRLAHPEVISILQGEAMDYGFHYLPGTRTRSQRTVLDFLHKREMDRIWVGYFSAALSVNGVRNGVLLYSVQVQDMVDSLLVIQDQMLLCFIAVAAAVFILSLFFSQIITKPIAALTAGIQRMARGDLSGRVEVSGGGEMARLAETFNQMSEKLENLDHARNQFVSNASHELKTPLATMKILLESVLYQDDMDLATRKEFLGDINKEIDRLTLVISDLLTLVHIDSRKMKLRREDIRLSDVVKETVQRLKPLYDERDQVIEVQIGEECPLFADAAKLQQVLYNLLENAIKYSADRGVIRIAMRREGKNAVLEIKDSGVGIPKAD
ncbi:MAG: HAMP domain-containing sensor histidine kinase, partial [Clostridia bacterium]